MFHKGCSTEGSFLETLTKNGSYRLSERSLVRFQMVSLEFIIDIPVAIWP